MTPPPVFTFARDVPLHVTTVSLDDATVWYEERGEGPPLVFIHGGWSSAEAWTPQFERFADDYRVVRFDVRGHGETGPTDRDRYSIDLYADDLERLLDHLDVDRPILCGLSLGSMVAQTFLDRHPARAAGAVLAGPVRSMPPVDLPRWIKPALSPVPSLGLSLGTMGSEATFRSMLGAIRATTGSVWLSVDRSVRAAAIETAGEMPREEFRKTFAALYRHDPPDLSHVESPVSVVYGDEEAIPVKQQGRALAREVDGTLTEVADAGHLVNLDNTEAFDAACRSFLATLPAR